MIFTHEITLDVTINQIKTLNIKQYTKGSFKLHVNLTDRSEPFKANKNTQHCYFKMETPDKKHIFTDATINDDGSVDISIPEKACLAAGSGTAELVFKEQAEERIFATMNLNVNIIPSAYHNSHITSSDDFDALQQALFAADKTYNQVMESAAASALLAQSYAKGDTNSRESEDADNARYYKEEAEKAKNTAADYSSAAQSSADTASTKADESANSATSAAASADTAATKANESAEHAKTSRSYAIGDTDLRENEENDCAKHYYEQAQYYCNLAQDVKDSLGSALRPMGTRTFANLPALADVEAGDMYNVSDQFTTNGNFEEGAGNTVPAGSNVYKTVGGKWDVLAGSPVTGIKGNAESSYRKGNVNITPENIGLGNVNNTADSAKNVSSAKLLAVQENNYRQGTDLPSTYPRGVTVFLSDNPTNKFNGITYCTIHTIKGYTNMACIQFLYPYNTNHDKIYFREALYNSDSWRPWHEVITSANIASQNVASATKATQDGDGNVIKDTYLPLNGGTISGNLRLKGSGNYGNTLNFGDGDYVHISEPIDDNLEIKAKNINFVTSSTNNGVLKLNGDTIKQWAELFNGAYNNSSAIIFDVYKYRSQIYSSYTISLRIVGIFSSYPENKYVIDETFTLFPQNTTATNCGDMLVASRRVYPKDVSGDKYMGYGYMEVSFFDECLGCGATKLQVNLKSNSSRNGLTLTKIYIETK